MLLFKFEKCSSETTAISNIRPPKIDIFAAIIYSPIYIHSESHPCGNQKFIIVPTLQKHKFKRALLFHFFFENFRLLEASFPNKTNLYFVVEFLFPTIFWYTPRHDSRKCLIPELRYDVLKLTNLSFIMFLRIYLSKGILSFLNLY